jgi:proton-translocating NADH-quinone oxidoreductase chain L
MKLILIFIPLLNSLVCGLGNTILKGKDAAKITFFSVLLIFFSFLHEGFVFLFDPKITVITLFDWINISSLTIKWEFLFDSLTYAMLGAVLTISTFVHIYSMDYMEHDPRLTLFLSYLSLFTFFMVILVTSSNLLVTILGWEGVGLCSYLLISFWYTRIQANKAALKAILMNRIGDFAFLLAICTIFLTYRTIDFKVLPYIVNTNYSNFDTVLTENILHDYVNILGYNINVIDFICFFLFMGAVGKSAQIGLHTWLPDAMEGPTPVSALIHAATMVTAGVFLIIRCSFFFEKSPTILFVIVIVGAITCFFAASIGIFQYDIKKVIAYSTCSQLGYMVFACGNSNFVGGLYHLYTHAFFKALLFLCAGSVIHAIADEQNMKRMGGLVKLLPFTYTCMLIGSLALTGFPFFSGFYSKDFIIETSYNIYTVESIFAYWLGSISALFTSFYSIRLLVLTYLVKTNAYKNYLKNIHEAPSKITFVLFTLTIFSIFVGFFFKEIFIGFNSDFFIDAIAVDKKNDYFDIELMPVFYKNIPVIFSILGSLIGYFFYLGYSKLFSQKLITNYYYSLYNITSKDNFRIKKIKKLSKIRNIYIFFNQKWHFDKLYNNYIGESFLWLGYHATYKCLDKGFFELFGPTGFYNSVGTYSKYLSRLQTGLISDYILLVLITIIVLLSVYEFYFINIFI